MTSSAMIEEAIVWLANTPRSQRGPAVPELQRRFGLSAAEAVAVIREVALRHARAT